MNPAVITTDPDPVGKSTTNQCEGLVLVDPEITSENPMVFYIVEGETTTLVVRFSVDNQVVDFQTGDLKIMIEVDDSDSIDEEYPEEDEHTVIVEGGSNLLKGFERTFGDYPVLLCKLVKCIKHG